MSACAPRRHWRLSDTRRAIVYLALGIATLSASAVGESDASLPAEEPAETDAAAKAEEE